MESDLPVSGAPIRVRAVRELADSVSAAAPRHRWPLLHMAGRTLGVLIGALPRRWRFGAAVCVSVALRPLIRRTTAYREHRGRHFDSLAEAALFRVLEGLAASGTCFDPVLRVEGMEHLEGAMAEGRGVFLTGPHAMLTPLVLRRVHDLGWPQMAIAADPPLLVSGTREVLPTLLPSAGSLITVRSRLREGGLVSSMIDRMEEQERRTVRFATARGPVQIADAMIPLALRCGARVVFVAVRVQGREVVARFAAPSLASRTADAVTADFVLFVQAHVAAHAAGDDVPARPAPELWPDPVDRVA